MALPRWCVLPVLALALTQLCAADPNHGVAGIGVLAHADVPIHGETRLHDHLIVRRVMADSPAEKSGLHTGDEIVEIDGARVAGLRFEDAVNKHLRGPLGTPVKLTVLRGSQRLTFVIVRDIVPVEQPGL